MGKDHFGLSFVEDVKTTQEWDHQWHDVPDGG